MDNSIYDIQSPGPGHNLAPEDQTFEALKARADDLAAAAERAVAHYPKIEDEETAGRFADFLEQLRGCAKDVEGERKAQKQPHIDAGKGIDVKFGALKTLLDACTSRIKPMQTAWLMEVRRRQDEERKKAEDAALKAMEEADAAEKAAAESGGIAADVAAGQAHDRANEAVAEAERMASVTAQAKGMGSRGVSLRTTWRAEITDYAAALNHYRNHPKLRDVIAALAAADARSPEMRKTAIPGVEFHAERKAA